MGARSDKILGRAKQALGAITGDNKMRLSMDDRR